MTNVLVKIFVKDYDRVEDQHVRTSYGTLASVVGIICNVFLFVVKFAIGWIIHSITVSADSFNNLSDAASSVIGFIGVKLASRPADKEHPFGHGRAEYISAFIVSFLVIQVGFTCGKSSIEKIIHPERIEFNAVLVGILGLSIIVKVWLAYFNHKLGKRINSKVMLATAADAKGDVVITSATVVSILIGYFTNLAIDGYAGLVVSIFVLIAGVNIARDTLEPLLGEAIDRDLYNQITQIVEGHEGIAGSHDLVVHAYGPSRRMATIHAEVPNDITIEHAHEQIDHIELEVMEKLGVFLTIHMDPVEVNNEKIKEQKRIVLEIIHGLEKDASIHDFRVVVGEHQTNLIFDLVIPYTYKPKQVTQLLAQIRDQVKEVDHSYNCVIVVENSFVGD